MVTMTEKDREDAEWSGDPQVLLLWSIVKQAERDQEEAVVRALTAQAWAVACAICCSAIILKISISPPMPSPKK